MSCKKEEEEERNGEIGIFRKHLFAIYKYSFD